MPSSILHPPSSALTALFPDNPELAEQIARQDRAFARALLDRLTRPLPTTEPWHWVLANVFVKTPTIAARFEPNGREYMRDQINDINDDTVAEQTCCQGTGAGKTMKNVAQALWAFANDPFSGLYVMPAKDGEGGARHFNNGSMIPSIENTECFLDKLPVGADRHNFSGLHLEFAGNNLGFVGANSPTQLGAKRCRIVWLDEQDKYKEKLGREAGADYLAGERTKQVFNKKIIRGSTPTRDSFGIWPHLMRSDLRRRFLPCPHCNSEVSNQKLATGIPTPALPQGGYFVLVKDARFSVLPDKCDDGTPIPAAPMAWDKEAKRKDGTWDIDRVVRSARFECPHCGGHIRDHHRLWMDKHGFWHPTRIALLHRGYHLSSYYAPHIDFDSSLGGMAKKFLDKFHDGSIAGYINSDLAEVHAAQEHGRNTIEITSHPTAREDWVPQLTADYQKNWPYLWFVVRKWCAFKLLPPFPITNGVPDFVHDLEQPENAGPREKCAKLLGLQPSNHPTIQQSNPAWVPIAELMRFDSRTGSSPLVEFLLAQDITGEKLVKLYRETAGGNTQEFRKVIYRLMSQHLTPLTSPLSPPRGGDSELVAAGHLALSGEYVWDELKEIIQHYQIGRGMAIPGRCVAIDCGYAEKFNREVLRKCYESATEHKFYDPLSKNRPALFYKNPIHNYCLPASRDGWFALKGYPMNQRWNHGGIRNELNVNIEDPFFGTTQAGTCVQEVLELPSGVFWRRKEDLRNKRTKHTYTVNPAVAWYPKIHDVTGADTGESNFKLADYEKHLNEQYYDELKGKVEPKHGRGGSQSRAHPYHLDDCETYQIALATHHEFFEETEPK